MQLKIVAFTPMPSVRHRTAVTVNAGFLTSVRIAKRMSWSMSERDEGPLAQTVSSSAWFAAVGVSEEHSAAGGVPPRALSAVFEDRQEVSGGVLEPGDFGTARTVDTFVVGGDVAVLVDLEL